MPTNYKQSIVDAYHRLSPYLHHTPTISSESLNRMLGHEVFFKTESMQKTGAFKVRGALNHLLSLKEKNKLPPKIVGYSTGNHGIGMAWAAKKTNIHARVYLPKDTAYIKQKAAEYYGAEVIYTETRVEAENRAKTDSENGYYYLHPSDSHSTIYGVATLFYESIEESKHKYDAIFASCGGGGLLSGAFLAKESFSSGTLVFGTEPENANDAYNSIQNNKIFSFNKSPDTIADGLKTLKISELTFNYLQKIDGMFLVSEDEIKYWTAWLMHLLKITCEPSCAINMAALATWLKTQKEKKRVLVTLSGGNIDPALYHNLSKKDYLLHKPKL